MARCPCGSKKDYLSCCGLYIDQKIPAPTPEALMRARYTAYTLANMDYIKRTMSGKALSVYDEKAAMQWAKTVKWRCLKVMEAMPVQGADTEGFVAFKAVYNEAGVNKTLHERSLFHKIKDQWFYIDGICYS